ncbi:HAD-IA family hydrolase [Streptosporangium lutulentum]
MSFDALLCDLDGVIRLYQPDGLADVERVHGLAEGTVTRIAFAPPLLTQAVTGVISDEQWQTRIAATLERQGTPPSAARELATAFVDAPHRIDHEVLELLAVARRRLPVVLVTNGTTRLESDLLALGLADAVDAVVNSARVGVAKPDARIYEIAAERAGIPAERCLFVDDSPTNVEAARAMGMSGIVYRGERTWRT